MGVIEKAVDFMVSIANDSAHGYDQANRWGPDYDCSSLVISAYEQAGVPVKSKGATYTGNMKSIFLACGFKDVTAQVNRSTGAGLQTGDVLLNEQHHTAMYIGGGKLVQASINEKGGIRNGQTGDQTGREIASGAYYNFPWDCVLRYDEQKEESAPIGGAYTVKAGDTLWSLAEEWLGAGYMYPSIITSNNLTSTVLHVGQVLTIPGKTDTSETEGGETVGDTCTVKLPALRSGDTGGYVETMQYLILKNGYSLPKHGPDGEFGDETEAALRQFQKDKGLTVDGVCGEKTWVALLS